MASVRDDEITPEMIDAGLEVLENSGRLIEGLWPGVDRLLVQELFVAMWQNRPRGSC
jgi:hypothetical protein